MLSRWCVGCVGRCRLTVISTSTINHLMPASALFGCTVRVEPTFFSETRGQRNRSGHEKLLVAMFLAADQLDARRRYSQIRGKHLNDLFVGIAISRRRCRFDSHLVILHTQNFIAAGPRLDADEKPQVFALPLSKRESVGIQASPGRKSPTRMASACRPIMATIGEMSRPPSVGIQRLNGNNTGLTTAAMKAVAGL